MMIFAVVGMLTVVCAIIIVNDTSAKREKKFLDIIEELSKKKDE